MPAKAKEEVYAHAAPDEGAALAMPVGTVRAAAEAAAEAFGPDEVDKHAQAILDAWEVKLKEQTREYTRRAMALARGEKAMAGGGRLEMAGAIGQPAGLPPYPWFDLLAVGPFQPVPAAGPPPFPPAGPFLPHRVIRAAEPAFMLGALWRNPAGINWDAFNPAAAAVMSALNFTVQFEVVNLTSVSNGPDLAPVVLAPIGGGFLNVFVVPIPAGFFPAPPQGKPTLYEIHMTVDATGPGPAAATLPFSGFSTWVFDPDGATAIAPPFILPGVAPGYRFDVPARILVHS